MTSILDKIYDGSKGDKEEVSPYLKLGIYGPAGAGKTVFAASAPKPIWFDMENSTEALDDWPELKKECKIAKCDSWNDAGELLNLAVTNDPLFHDRETIVVDTVSASQDRMNTALLKKYSDDPNSNRNNEYLADEGIYRESGERLRRFVTTLRDLPYHVIFLAHDRIIIDEKGRITAIYPQITPALATSFERAIGLLGYLTSEEDNNTYKRQLRVRHTRLIRAKTRYRHLPTIVENPTFDTIYKAKTREDKEKDKAK